VTAASYGRFRLLYTPVALGEDEVVILARPANRVWTSGAIGGRVLLTNRRLIFQPHRLDRALRGTGDEAGADVAWNLGDITVSAEPVFRTGRVVAAGLRVKAVGRQETLITRHARELAVAVEDVLRKLSPAAKATVVSSLSPESHISLSVPARLGRVVISGAIWLVCVWWLILDVFVVHSWPSAGPAIFLIVLSTVSLARWARVSLWRNSGSSPHL
jgi:hypothetical protein